MQGGFQSVRFVGVDGPRWFLRALFTGAAATDPARAAALEDAVRNIVVVRGSSPMPVRDPLPLQLPKEVADQAEQRHGAHAAPDDPADPADFDEEPEPAPDDAGTGAGRRRTARRRPGAPAPRRPPPRRPPPSLTHPTRPPAPSCPPPSPGG